LAKLGGKIRGKIRGARLALHKRKMDVSSTFFVTRGGEGGKGEPGKLLPGDSRSGSK